jgi:deoxyribodipyrimidine photo-lyase
MNLLTEFPPTREAAIARVNAVRPGDYERSRNFINGAVTGLSPYITHGILSLTEVLSGVTERYPLQVQHKFVFELGWREYFRHVWQARGDGIFSSLHRGPLDDEAYSDRLPTDIREGATGIPVIDMAVQTLYSTGYLHNHARMWLASYVVHIRKVHWRVGADWLYGHLLDGDLASNHLSWQWVAGTGSNKPYLFNADNVARYAPKEWHSPGSSIDYSYDTLDQVARQTRGGAKTTVICPQKSEPPLTHSVPFELNLSQPSKDDVAGRNVWIVHPWNMHESTPSAPEGTLMLGVLLSDFHKKWPWNERRWRFVTSRMSQLTSHIWQSDASTIAQVLKGARSVRTTNDLHLHPWISQFAECKPSPCLFPTVDRRCDSFSQWWSRATKKTRTVNELFGENAPNDRLFP